MPGQTFLKYMDAPDVGDNLSFFAVQSSLDERLWTWRYGLSFPSTVKYGTEGRAGDGIDVTVAEGRSWVPLDYPEGCLDDVATGHMPSIPDDVMEEYWDDDVLCEMSDVAERFPDMGFEELYMEATEIDELDEVDREQLAKLREHARNNGWDFAD